MHWCKRLHYDAEMLAATRLQHTEILIFPLVYCRHLKKKPLASTADITNHWGCHQKSTQKFNEKFRQPGGWDGEMPLKPPRGPVCPWTIRHSGWRQPLPLALTNELPTLALIS